MCSEQIGEEVGGRKRDFLETIEISVTGSNQRKQSSSMGVLEVRENFLERSH